MDLPTLTPSQAAFLTSLLQGVSATSVADAPAATPAPAAFAPRPLTSLALGASYEAIPGFDSGKMNNLTQDIGLLGAPTTASLQSVVDQYNKATGSSATVKGQDTIDFGGEIGVVDVIFSVDGPDARWQWITTT